MNPISASLISLQKRWLVLLSGYLLLLALGFLWLQEAWTPVYARRWAALTAIIAAVQLARLWQALPQNHRADSAELLPTLGWGNGLSLGRGMLLAGLGGFLFAPWPPGWLAWLPGSLYLVAALSDFLDGYLARITNHVTRLGEALDIDNDAWGILIATALAFQYGQVPLWYVPVGLARYIFLAGLRLRQIRGLSIYELPFSVRRRAFAGVQMGFLVAILFPVFEPPGTTIAAGLFMLPFLVGFGYDWLLVSGRISARQNYGDTLRLLANLWTPLLLRIIAMTGLTALIVARPEFLATGGLVLAMIALGLAGRLAGILALLLVGFHLQLTSLSPWHLALLLSGTGLLFLGSGPLSLWTPEDWLIYRRAGESVSDESSRPL